MTRRPDKPTVFTPDDDAGSSAPVRRGKTFIPDDATTNERPPEAIDGSGEAVDDTDLRFHSVKLSTRPLRGLKLLAGLLATYCVLLLIYHTWQLTDSLWQLHPLLGGAFIGFCGVLLASGAYTLFGWWRDADRMSYLHRLQTRAEHLRTARAFGSAAPLIDDLGRFYADKPQATAFEKMKGSLPDYADDREAIEHIEQHFLAAIDREARNCIAHYSAQTGVAVAVSPWGTFDMLITLLRNLKMVSELSRLYGIRPSLRNRLAILVQVLSNMAFAGTSEAALDNMSGILDAGLLAQLSGRAGQGVGTALISVRVGLLAQSACRPIPFTDEAKPTLKSFVATVVGRIRR